MARLYNTFEFVGNVHIPKSRDKFLDVNDSTSGWSGHRLNFGIQESKTNSVFLELYGGYNKAKANKVFSFSKGTENVKGSKLEIPWEDRLEQDTIDMVADFKKVVVDYTTDQELKEQINQLKYDIRNLEYKDELTEDESSKLIELRTKLREVAADRKEFITEYDALIHLSNTLEAYKSHKFRITGRVEFNYWNGKFHRKFKPELIEIVPSDSPSQLRATMDIFFTQDALDEKDFKKEKKLYIDGYVMSYDNQEKKDMFFPQQFIINATKVDMENELHVKRLDFLKNKFKPSKKGVYHLQWLVNIFRGADQVEFTEKDLTASQKEAIEFGLNKFEDFVPKGGVLGESVVENRLVKPVLQKINDDNDFTGGAASTDLKEEDLAYVSSTGDSSEKPKPEKKEEPTVTEKTVDVDLEDLFG
jgi:hypothetical protein